MLPANVTTMVKLIKCNDNLEAYTMAYVCSEPASVTVHVVTKCFLSSR